MGQKELAGDGPSPTRTMTTILIIIVIILLLGGGGFYWRGRR